MAFCSNARDVIHRRYLLVDGTKEDLEKAIINGIGIIGYARADPFFISSLTLSKKLSSQRKNINKGIILAVERDMLMEIKKVLDDSSIRIIKVSGTIKKLQ